MISIHCSKCGGWIEVHADENCLTALEGKAIARRNGDEVKIISGDMTGWSATHRGACCQPTGRASERTCMP